MALGTWGGQGPEGAKLLARITKKVGRQEEGASRGALQAQARYRVGFALMTSIFDLLPNKNFIQAA